jgi:hypothetical protein
MKKSTSGTTFKNDLSKIRLEHKLQEDRHQIKSSKCPNQLRLHQEDHRRKEENDQDHQFFDKQFQTKEMILSEDHHLIHHHQIILDMIKEEITMEGHHLDHLQE